jgi:hypothetical protein
MRPSIAKLVVAATIILGVGTLPIMRAGAQDAKTGKIDPKMVATQKAAAEKYWKEAFESDKVPLVETKHFLVVAKSAKDATAAGNELEQQLVKARKILEVEKEPLPWQGKLTVLILSDAEKYPRMIRLLERRKAEDGEYGAYEREGEFPFVVASDGGAPGDLGAAANAGVQLATLLLTVRAKTALPVWLNEGFGRATVLNSGPAVNLAADRRKVGAFLKKSNRTLDDIFDGKLDAEEQAPLQGSLVDYLAYSGRTAKFLPFIEGFRMDINGNAGSLDTALKNASITKDQLQNNWLKYARAFK